MSPKGQELAGELCDGIHLTCMIPERPDVVMDNIEAGFAKREDGKRLEDFELMTSVPVVILNGKDETIDTAQGKMYGSKAGLALYIGGMGAKNKNFYKEYFDRAGFEEEANKIQELFLAGKQDEAIAAVTDDMVRTVHLVGTKDEIAERFKVWQQSPLTTMLMSAAQPEAMELIADLAS